jgi:hypothetical protein
MDGASRVASVPLIAEQARGAFFWSIAAQQVVRTVAVFPFRDVSAAAAGVAAFTLWALALSLILG